MEFVQDTEVAMSLTLVCVAALLQTPPAAGDVLPGPVEINGQLETSRACVVAIHFSGIVTQSSSAVYTSWYQEGSRISLGLMSASRRGGCCGLVFADAYVFNGLALGGGVEVSRAGFSPVLEVVWYPIDGVQLAISLDTVKGLPFVWGAFRRD
jgi:hypothetical protein